MSQSGLAADHGVSWPSNGISEVPFRVYTDLAQYAREQERLFKGPTWNYLCLTVELAKPGDYVATTVGETAIIVVRDATGAINAFVNRCAHRGNLLCLERQGNVREFGCIYHGWVYDLTGQLTGVAFERGVHRQGGMPPEFHKEDHRLRQLRVAELGGLVFGTFSDATPDLETFLGADVTRGLLRVMNRTPHVLGRNIQIMPNNWKLYFENVKDTYHASILHLFLTTFRINRLTMPGGIYINQDGGNHYSFAKLDYAAEDQEYKDAGLRSESEFRLQDNSVVESVDEYGDGVSVQILTIFPGMVLQQVRNTIAVRVIRPGTVSSRRRMVRAVGMIVSGRPIRVVHLRRLCARAAITVHAAFATNLPEGKCARAWSLRSRIASSTTACWRCSDSTSPIASVRLVRNAKCRQSGHSSACAPIRRVRRTISRWRLSIVCAICASPPSG